MLLAGFLALGSLTHKMRNNNRPASSAVEKIKQNKVGDAFSMRQHIGRSNKFYRAQSMSILHPCTLGLTTAYGK